MDKAVKSSALAATALLSLLAGLGGCSRSSTIEATWTADHLPEYHHPNQGWWRYKFAYYPDSQVYYHPYRRMYYWYENGVWEEGHVLPTNLICTLSRHDMQVVKLQEEKPYVQHLTVLQWHKPYHGRFDGSTDPVHSTAEFIAQSEMRSQQRTLASGDAYHPVPFTPGPGTPASDPLWTESSEPMFTEAEPAQHFDAEPFSDEAMFTEIDSMPEFETETIPDDVSDTPAVTSVDPAAESPSDP
jgi:hypothetical protein